MNDTAWVTILAEEDIRKLIADVYDVPPCKVKLDSSFNGGIYAKIADPNNYQQLPVVMPMYPNGNPTIM